MLLFQDYFDAAYKKPYTWDPAFLSCTLLTEQNYNLQKEGGKSNNILLFIPQIPVLINLFLKHLYLFLPFLAFSLQQSHFV